MAAIGPAPLGHRADRIVLAGFRSRDADRLESFLRTVGVAPEVIQRE